jgi:hypothetical protein
MNMRGMESKIARVDRVICRVAWRGRNVRDFVGHHAGQLSFVIRGENQTRVHIQETSRLSECVDLLGINYLDSEGHFGVGVANQVLP